MVLVEMEAEGEEQPAVETGPPPRTPPPKMEAEGEELPTTNLVTETHPRPRKSCKIVGLTSSLAFVLLF
ncbi:hypothetical protein Hdeb2414_s0019g00546031 [Helianthus debilis subsp. tardiflorus]